MYIILLIVSEILRFFARNAGFSVNFETLWADLEKYTNNQV
jgi:hypothetical protein